MWRSLQQAANYPKEPGLQSQLIGFKDASIPMSLALDPDPPHGRHAVTGTPTTRPTCRAQENTSGVTTVEVQFPNAPIGGSTKNRWRSMGDQQERRNFCMQSS
jgi:hypothetical protein